MGLQDVSSKYPINTKPKEITHLSPYMAKQKLLEGRKKKFKGFTIKDYNCLTEKDAIDYDERTFNQYLLDKLFNEHPLISLAGKKSMMDPLILRFSKFLFRMTLIFALNAMFFSDDYMEEYALKYLQYITFVSRL